AHVQNRCERRQPGLVTVLGPIVSKYRVGQMAFQNLRGPTFPIVKESRKFDKGVSIEMTYQQFCGCGWRSGTGVEHRYVEFTSGERLIKHGQVPNDDRQKAEPQPCLDYGQSFDGRALRENVAQTQCEEG